MAPRTDTTPSEWFITGAARSEYIARRDTTMRRSGQASGMFRPRETAATGFGTLSQSLRADSTLQGKRVRLSAWIRTRDADGAYLWLRSDTPEGMYDFDNGQEEPLMGTNDWTRRELVIDVGHSVGIIYGVILQSRGQLWLDDVSLEVVPPSVPRSAGGPLPMEAWFQRSGAAADSVAKRWSSRPATTRNTGFEQP